MRFLILTLALLPTALPAQSIVLEEVVSGLSSPVALTHAHDTRLFITQQRGQVRVFDGTRLLPTPFLDIQPLVSCCGERGLLSIAFHPRYRENGFFYVYYTDLEGDITIARYSVSADPNVANANSRQQILEIPHRDFSNHNGGQLQFGPDGLLYIGTGDGGAGGDPLNNGQNLASLLGKILRIDVDSGTPYAIPPGNPFRNTAGARAEIWSYGLRNPWRFSFDRASGDLWIGDVGQNRWEEVNLQRATSIGGENYGWRRMEGTHCFNPPTNCQTSQMVLPVIEYPTSSPDCSVTGGYLYRGTANPRYRGQYIFGDYCSGRIFAASQNAAGMWPFRILLDTSMNIPAFGEDAAGELYVVDHRGAVYRLVDREPLPSLRRRAVRR